MTVQSKAQIKAEIAASSANGLLGGTILDNIVDSYSDPINALIADNGGLVDVSAEFDVADASGQIFLPPGVYNVPTANEFGSWRSWGFGQIKDDQSNNRAPFHASISAPPASSVGSGGDPQTYFNGDLTACQFPIEHWISGTALGAPTSGYLFTPEAYPFFISMYNSSGWNQSTSTNDGRTAAVVFHTHLFQAGQGDAVVYDANVFVAGPTRAGATHFLANPAGTIINGSIQAGVAGVLLNPAEFELIDDGFDVAAVGWVFNFERTNNTGALSAAWTGIRLQSIGSKAIDAGYQITGPANCGMDLTSQTFDVNKNAISLPTGARIYFNATSAGAVSLPVVGNSWIEHNGSGIVVVAGGATAYQFYSGVAVLGGILEDVGGAQLLTTRQTGWNAPTGSLSRGTFDSGANLATTAQTLAALITDLRTHGLIFT